MLGDLNCLSKVWNNGADGLDQGDSTIIMSLRDFPVLGSFLSSNRLVVISQVLAEASPAAKATCLARHEANLVLLLDDKTEANVGTSLILVPSRNFMD